MSTFGGQDQRRGVDPSWTLLMVKLAWVQHRRKRWKIIHNAAYIKVVAIIQGDDHGVLSGLGIYLKRT